MNLVNMAGLRPSLEVIAFQNDDFPQKLESLIREVMDFHDKNPENGRKNTNSFGFTRKIESLVYDRFGFKTIVNLETEVEGAVMPFFATRYHVLTKTQYHGDPLKQEVNEQTKILREMTNKKGTIDLKRAKVSGIFSEFIHDVWLDVYGLYKKHKLTSAEITAVVIHEFGHAFTYYEFSDRLNGTNQVLMQMFNDLVDNDSKQTREYYIREFSEKFEIDPRELEDVLEEENRVIFGQRIFEHYVKSVGSQLPIAKYNENSSEQLADNFATRFGYGRELITALDKLWSVAILGLPAPQKSMPMFLFAYLFEIFQVMQYVLAFLVYFKKLIVSVITFDVYGVFVLYQKVLSIGMVIVAFWMSTGDDGEDLTYDLLKIRYTRIKHQYVEILKKGNLDKEKTNKVLSDIKAMDKVIDETYIYKPLFTHIKNLLIPSSRRAMKDMDRQKLLEVLAHNPLFIRAAELQSLTLK